jgi:uncharacterized protein
MADRKPLQSLLVKPAGPDCNMNCTYCFYSRKESLFPETSMHRMDENVLTEVISQFLGQAGPEVSITWQGGEPTLMGTHFFEKAALLQKRFGAGKTIGNGLQTNGLLIDANWAKFFRRYSFLIGLSIDGPAHVHDYYRTMKGGQATWRKVNDNARLLLDEGVSVNALSVVNDYSVRFPDEIYASHKETGLSYMQFVPCLEETAGQPGIPAPFSVSPQAYGEFLCRVFDLWLDDFRDGMQTTSVRFFESLLFSYAGFPAVECTLMDECGRYLVIEHNGDVFACDFFVEPGTRLGNVMTSRLADMLNSERQTEFGKAKGILPQECSRCGWLRFCRGGCPRDRISGRLNYYCSSFKLFFSHADSALNRLVEEWRERQVGELKPAGIDLRRTGRNEPCPCGSGKKYKRCCGRD